MSSLKDIGEREAIRRLARVLGASDALVGIGDDAAVIRVEGSGFDWLLTSDPVIEGTHFTVDASPAGIGHKAVGRVLSDIAAMGGDPLWILVDIVAPPVTEMERLESIYEGAAKLAAEFDAAIIGGDMAQGSVLELHAFAVGRVPEGAALLRSGAKPGDLVYVTGDLGGSIAGRHLTFKPRITEALWLREESWPTALMDVSDGLAADLRNLGESSGVGFDVDVSSIPISQEVGKDRDAVGHALCDGEDFELLFTVPAGKKGFFESSWADTFELACTCIGVVTEAKNAIMLVEGEERTPLEKSGYEHFTG